MRYDIRPNDPVRVGDQYTLTFEVVEGPDALGHVMATCLDITDTARPGQRRFGFTVDLLPRPSRKVPSGDCIGFGVVEPLEELCPLFYDSRNNRFRLAGGPALGLREGDLWYDPADVTDFKPITRENASTNREG